MTAQPWQHMFDCRMAVQLPSSGPQMRALTCIPDTAVPEALVGPQVQDHHILVVAAWEVEPRNPVGHHTLEDHRIPEAVPAWLQERRSRAVLHTGLAAPVNR